MRKKERKKYVPNMRVSICARVQVYTRTWMKGHTGGDTDTLGGLDATYNAGSDLADLMKKVDEKMEHYDETKDTNVVSSIEYSEAARENIFNKGQSKRIWAELHKVIDSSDVIVQVLDVRDPMGTRCPYVEALLKRPTARHKHLILILNKCDLVPTWVTARWIKILSAEYPTLAFHASINNPFGKGALIQLLRQFGQLHSDKKHLSVGFFGYPNVGKSSIINTLRKKRVCKAAPLPGETKVWQYVTLFRGIYLIDCPGTVYDAGDDDMTTVVKGVVRVENIEMPSQYVQGVFDVVKKMYLQRSSSPRLSLWQHTHIHATCNPYMQY